MIGNKIHQFSKELCLINRSITGEEVRATLKKLSTHLIKLAASLCILTNKEISPLQFLRDYKSVSRHTNLHTDHFKGYMTSIIYFSDMKKGERGAQFFTKSNRYIYDVL